ncbi:hypothetical protein AALT_g11514 [Alternaria alternata]|nr:hypothetical protein AALT_g11514 [Alternaria alternata]
MDSSSAAPPAYVENASDPYWKIRNTKYSSVFVTKGPPNVEDYRTLAKHIKNSFLERGVNPGSSASGISRFVEVQSSQAFSNIERLIHEYQNVLHTIEPLNEEDVLFLLLSRYSQSSGACVYMEIKRPGEVQIFDSAIVEPPHMSSIQEHMACAPGMITAELHEPLLEDSMTDVPYNPVPQTPSAAEFDFAVSINFPEMLMVTPTATPESTTTTDDPPTYTDTPTAGGGFLPAKLQPPAFSVHRCHHRGMDRRGEEDAFELPFGFPEVIQHLHTIPSHQENNLPPYSSTPRLAAEKAQGDLPTHFDIWSETKMVPSAIAKTTSTPNSGKKPIFSSPLVIGVVAAIFVKPLRPDAQPTVAMRPWPPTPFALPEDASACTLLPQLFHPVVAMDKAARVLAQGLPPAVPTSYHALADHGEVPPSTLYARAQGRRSMEEKAQSQQYLSPCEEDALVNFLIQMSDLGQPVRIKFIPFLAFCVARPSTVT